MNDDFLEKLSALVDGELNDFEIRQFLRQLDQVSEEERVAVYQRWQRMQLASSVVQSTLEQATAASSISEGSVDGQPSQSFVGAVSEAIGNDVPDDVSLDETGEELLAESSAFQAQALHSVGEEAISSQAAVQATTQVTAIENHSKTEQAPFWSRFAVAASVALAVVVGVQQYQMGVQQERILAAGSKVQQVDQTQVTLLAELQSAQSEEEQIAAQQRLMDYLQQRKTQSLGSGAADPYARVATFADDEAEQ